MYLKSDKSSAITNKILGLAKGIVGGNVVGCGVGFCVGAVGVVTGGGVGFGVGC